MLLSRHSTLASFAALFSLLLVLAMPVISSSDPVSSADDTHVSHHISEVSSGHEPHLSSEHITCGYCVIAGHTKLLLPGKLLSPGSLQEIKFQRLLPALNVLVRFRNEITSRFHSRAPPERAIFL